MSALLSDNPLWVRPGAAVRYKPNAVGTEHYNYYIPKHSGLSVQKIAEMTPEQRAEYDADNADGYPQGGQVYFIEEVHPWMPSISLVGLGYRRGFPISDFEPIEN